ncbi:MAG: DUF6587 family protein [Dokdonella sp.]|uniref:DUF6587 family protein n=1 Tax=Dokdonella sp. TaxID=2291710 RepID=UPI00326557F0
MTAILVQALVILLVVGWSALFAVQRLLPVTSRRVKARILDRVDQPSSPAWLRGMARRAQPTSTSGGSCGDGCSACGGCAAAAAKPVEALPLVFRPRLKS